MTKSDLIERLALDRGITTKTARIVVEAALESMARALASGDRIELRGFGSFTLRDYEGYTGRNPKTGKPIDVEPKTLPVFKVGKTLRQRVDNGKGER